MTKSHVIQDSSFLLAVIDSKDALHSDAVYVFSELLQRKDWIQLLIPPLVMYEVIVALRRKGATGKMIETVLLRLVNLENVTVASLSELSAFKHATHALNSRDPLEALRTQDFLIFCVAKEFEGLLLTFDKKFYKRCKSVYSAVYYCSSLGNMQDETAEFLRTVDVRKGA